MNVICPRCKSEDTIPFSDSIYKTHGYQCNCCKEDFGVDDGTTLKGFENAVEEIHITHIYADSTSYTIDIYRSENGCFLTPSRIDDKRMKIPYQSIDFSNSIDGFIKLLFEQLFILDWKSEEDTEGDRIVIDIKYNSNVGDITIKQGKDRSPYFQVLEMMFTSLFEE